MKKVAVRLPKGKGGQAVVDMRESGLYPEAETEARKLLASLTEVLEVLRELPEPVMVRLGGVRGGLGPYLFLIDQQGRIIHTRLAYRDPYWQES